MIIGQLIDNRYEIIEEIGEGGMGKVFKVNDGASIVAMKICTETELINIERFKREVRLMSSVKHENVIEVLQCNLEYDPPYFIMPLCRFSIDTKIDVLMKKPKAAIEILMQACKGINAIHLSGIIHRDIKPKNLLLGFDNKVKVSDLGLGKFENRDSTILTRSNIAMGTEGYVPPEFYTIGGTKNADTRSDIYQLGKTIYNVFTDANPILIEKDKLPGSLLFIIQKCISNKPENRYQTVGGLENALNQYLLALDPKNDPKNAFETYLNEAKGFLQLNQYDPKNIEELIRISFEFKDDAETFFKQMQKVPLKLFEVIASNFNELCHEFLQVYLSTIKLYCKESQPNFSDADVIANTMNAIHRGSKDTGIRTDSMRLTLVTAVMFNRFNSMEIFDNMLKNVKSADEAVAVSEMLKEEIEYYKKLFTRIPIAQLHPLIRPVIEEANVILADEALEESKRIDDILKGFW